MRKCEVLINGTPAGILMETDSPREYTFRYYLKYLSDSSNAPVCLAMPLREETYRSPYLFPYFSNMLSEGENRAIQAAMLHLDQNDDFGFLMATARFDTIGSVCVRPLINNAE